MEFPWETLADVGPWGLVTICVLLIFTGRLVPGKDRDYWREAFFEQQKMTQELQHVTGKSMVQVLQALPPPAQEGE
jgi:hypothetical protein